MGKKVEAKIKLQIKMCQANPAPPVGPALGQRGVNIPEFCKGFNAKTQEIINEHEKSRKEGDLKIYEPGMVVPVVITVYSDRSFSFVVNTPPATALLKKVLTLPKGSKTPGTSSVGTVTRSQLEQVALAKQPDLTAANLEAAIRTIAGSARSMGLKVEV